MSGNFKNQKINICFLIFCFLQCFQLMPYVLNKQADISYKSVKFTVFCEKLKLQESAVIDILLCMPEVFYLAALGSSFMSTHSHLRFNSPTPNIISLRPDRFILPSPSSVNAIQLLKSETCDLCGFLHSLYPFSPSTINLNPFTYLHFHYHSLPSHHHFLPGLLFLS